MIRADLERLWQDDRHWFWSVVYACKEDPRLIVPKRKNRWPVFSLGWTWNFGHPLAWPVLLMSAALVVGPAWWYILTHGCPSIALAAGYVGVTVVVATLAGACYSKRFNG